MKNFKKLSRVQLKSVVGGRACSLAIQQSDGSWVTYSGSCSFHMGNANEGTGYPQGSHYCNIGDGKVHQLTSNGGVSHCDD
ncbi:bacteriocin-like protein [Chryseobacterium camelliae]|uniref:bacteriocin-like protein n=1 Tax=Chryseobacterium camelliae TaxID=1265445 RepID=UPI0028598D8D|nr:hypothetical protein [Chryseobacterium camelliae]MDR6517264.1 hypothetical protein [Chryseobacterium camelliae]